MTRVYLDQRIKFWMALMGLLTLTFVSFQGNGGLQQRKVNAKSAHHSLTGKTDETSSSSAEWIVLLYRSDIYDNPDTVSVSGASNFAKKNGYDFATLDHGSDLQKRILQTLNRYPKGGAIILEGTPRSGIEGVIEVPRLDLEPMKDKILSVTHQTAIKTWGCVVSAQESSLFRSVSTQYEASVPFFTWFANEVEDSH